VKTTVQVEGKSVEIEIPGVIPETEISTKYMPKDVVEQIVKDRLAQFAKGHVKIDGLDEAGKLALVKSLGIEVVEVDEDGTPAKGSLGKQLEAVKNEWVQKELTPVAEEAKRYKAEVESLRQAKLSDAIIAAGAKAGVLPALLSGPRPPIAALVGSEAFAFDEKSRSWYVKGENGFAISSSPTEGQPYKTADEYVAEWAKRPENKPFVGITTQGGANLGGGSASAGDGRVVLTKEQASDGAVWAEALKKVGGDASRIVVNDSKMRALGMGM
jgi:hypothetical protein